MVDITIEPTSESEKLDWPKEVLVDLDQSFADERGEIIPLVDLAMKSAVLITSKKGTVRANHYHQTDWHFCYVISGKIDYYHRPHGSDEPPELITIEQGQQFFTPPLVDHAMVFAEDTQFLTLGRNSRRQEVYEADVERIDPINPQT
jgi:dTDP-4-dehydrorhamnose 3,5-epimerase-like enzyme